MKFLMIVLGAALCYYAFVAYLVGPIVVNFETASEALFVR